MALAKSRLRLNVKGNGTVKIREIYPTQTDAFSDVGYVDGSVLEDLYNMIESVDEHGDFIDSKPSGEMVKYKFNLKQSTIDEINLLRNADGKYYDLYILGVLANGNSIEISAIPVKIKPGFSLDMAGGKERGLPCEMSLLAPKATATRAPTDYNVTVNKPFVLIENAVAKGVPTEATGTFTTLITAVL